MTAPRPARICPGCGEWLPHACAAVVTISRERYTGRRAVRIIDRAGPPGPPRGEPGTRDQPDLVSPAGGRQRERDAGPGLEAGS